MTCDAGSSCFFCKLFVGLSLPSIQVAGQEVHILPGSILALGSINVVVDLDLIVRHFQKLAAVCAGKKTSALLIKHRLIGQSCRISVNVVIFSIPENGKTGIQIYESTGKASRHVLTFCGKVPVLKKSIVLLLLCPPVFLLQLLDLRQSLLMSSFILPQGYNCSRRDAAHGRADIVLVDTQPLPQRLLLGLDGLQFLADCLRSPYRGEPLFMFLQ